MKKYLAMLLIAFITITGCTVTHITSSWKAPNAISGSYKRIMVVGIIQEADRSMREKMEMHLVGDLRSLGYNAVSAYQEYGPKTFEKLNEAEVKSKLAESDVDAVITIVLLDKKKERYYVPERVIYSPYYTYHDHFYGYYNSMNYRIGAPGYYEVETKYFWESNLYDLASDKLVYSAQTQSFEPKKTEVVAHEYGQKIVENMLKNKILQKQIPPTGKVM